MTPYKVDQIVITTYGLGIITHISRHSNSAESLIYYKYHIILIKELNGVDLFKDEIRTVTIWDKIKRFFGIKYKF